MNCIFLSSFRKLSVRRILLNKSLENLRYRIKGRVLEIGAGRIRRPNRFQPHYDSVTNWTFVDISQERQPHCQCDVQKLPFYDRVFDTVLCLEMLEYVESPQAALEEIHRILKVDGILIMSMPFLHRWDSNTDYWRLTQPGLERLLCEKSFRVESIEAHGGPFSVILNIIQFVLVQGHVTIFKCLLSGFLFPFLSVMRLLDPIITAQSSAFTHFTTGFIIVAQPEKIMGPCKDSQKRRGVLPKQKKCLAD